MPIYSHHHPAAFGKHRLSVTAFAVLVLLDQRSAR